MNDENVRSAWLELESLFGPEYYGQKTALKNKAQIYATLILEANDTERISIIGKRHLKLVSEKMLDGEQFDRFLQHVICYERRL